MPQTKVYKPQGGDSLVVASGGSIDVQSGGAMSAPGGANLLQQVLHLDIEDASAEAVYYLVSPHAGTISAVYSVIDSAVLTADVTITGKIGATAITNGVVTITQSGSAAGDIDTATPTAANVLTAGQAMNFTVTGGGAAGTGPRIHLAVVITR